VIASEWVRNLVDLQAIASLYFSIVTIVTSLDLHSSSVDAALLTSLTSTRDRIYWKLFFRKPATTHAGLPCFMLLDTRQQSFVACFMAQSLIRTVGKECSSVKVYFDGAWGMTRPSGCFGGVLRLSFSKNMTMQLKRAILLR
jgi:hypothetical protein